ncbi:SRPBCC family protein [Monashia sp. NPDC004114]
MGIFRFRHLWHVPADPAATFDALADVDRYPLWWPQVRAIRRIDDESGHAFVRSMLPYTLDLVLTREIEDSQAGVLRVRLGGDLEGWSEFRVSPDPDATGAGSYAADGSPGAATIADYRQEATVTAAGLEHFVPLARPLLTLNHTWMMRAGERGLARWLANGGSS